MKREIETKFFAFSQNNSGGYYIQNEEVNEFVIIEARNESEAISKLYEITEDYLEYCECCGPRWDSSIWGDGGYEKPTIKKVGYFNSEETAIVHYYDGTTEELIQ